MVISGLSMTLFVNQQKYVPVLTPEAGIKMLLHNQGETPDIFDAGFNLSPGFRNSIALTYVSI